MLLVDMSNIEVQKEVTVKPDSAQISPTKTEKQPLMELKNGKLVFRQKPLSCEKMSETMQEIVSFRDFLANRAKESNSPLQDVPEEHVPLIAKLVHESDKTISFLERHLQEALRPEETETDEANSSGASLTTIAIESAILRVCDRVNYGIDWMEKVSAATSVWRWEVKEEMYDMLPKASRERFESRLAERRQAKQELKALFDALPQSEKVAYTKSGKKAKSEISQISSTNDENSPNTHTATDGHIDMKSNRPANDNTEAKKSDRPKKDKPVDPERLAKEKERAEKKAAKEEKERKLQEAQNKSRSIMSSFFSKPKTTSSKILSPASASSSQKKEASSSQSEFEKAFKPFILKKNATLAPINYFHEAKVKEVIVIDQERSDPASRTHEVPSNSQGPFSEFIERVSSKRRISSGSYNTNGLLYKSSSAHSVRDLFARLSEAEILGDDTAVRSLQTLLASRDKIPAKVLIFHEDYRPGYFGTFTKSSVVVGPRTPFAKDAVAFDYSYDSEEDWEEEEEGADDLQSLAGAGSDVEKSSDVGDDEFDDWLVDDDEPIDPGTPLDERAGSPGFPLPQDLMPKRKTAPTEKESKEPKKRKVMPLVPFSKGPCLETNIGECEYEPFNQYRIQLFNDTPFPIDPFTFISIPIVTEKLAPSKQGFVVPALPPHIQNTSSNVDSMGVTLPQLAVAQSAATPMATVPTPVKRASMQPKNPFPTALLPYFADKVASLNSGNLTWLVESLYQDLRPHRVKKNAIEAKVREDCEKCPVRKIWIVKEDVLRTLGRTPLPSPNA
ncbi:hypothetical protein ACEPAI_5266 [Sanghuangporus weigelae]